MRVRVTLDIRKLLKRKMKIKRVGRSGRGSTSSMNAFPYIATSVDCWVILSNSVKSY